MHPTWRDLVIERLAADAALRRRFLAHCGVHGLVLALSVAGGAEGERRLPLLVSDGDWDTIGDRLYAVAAELETGELIVLLETLAATIDNLETAPDAGEARALSALVLTRVAKRWDAGHDAIALPPLGAWLRLARRLQPPPEPPSLGVTWAELLPARTPDPADVAEVQRFTDWLILCRLLAPEQLAPLGWSPDQMRPITEFVERVTADPTGFAADPVIQALEAASELHPWLGGRARRLIALLGRVEPEPWVAPPEPEAPGPAGGFDIDRVLADL